MQLLILCDATGIEVQLYSQAKIESGVNVTFPVQNINISVESEVPNPTISMHRTSEFYS